MAEGNQQVFQEGSKPSQDLAGYNPQRVYPLQQFPEQDANPALKVWFKIGDRTWGLKITQSHKTREGAIEAQCLSDSKSIQLNSLLASGLDWAQKYLIWAPTLSMYEFVFSVSQYLKMENFTLHISDFFRKKTQNKKTNEQKNLWRSVNRGQLRARVVGEFYETHMPNFSHSSAHPISFPLLRSTPNCLVCWASCMQWYLSYIHWLWLCANTHGPRVFHPCWGHRVL